MGCKHHLDCNGVQAIHFVPSTFRSDPAPKPLAKQTLKGCSFNSLYELYRLEIGVEFNKALSQLRLYTQCQIVHFTYLGEQE
ncbi:hypothetical protein OKW21_002360 [Catalinimonas alkaloidigena]|nr:hypothetical protein [Catalinimonas alkaloidigena]